MTQRISYLLLFFSLIQMLWGGCYISINDDLAEPQPLILRPEGGTGNDAFYLPTRGDTIVLSDMQFINLACPRSTLLLGGASTGFETEQATCVYGKFLIAGKTLFFSEISCSAMPYHTARATGKLCLSQYQEIEIGFVIGNRFLRQIIVCFDQIAQNTLYSQFALTKAIAGYQVGYPRPRWPEVSEFHDVGNISVNTFYTRTHQRATINALLGLKAWSYKYISKAGEYFLSRGHLAAKADFIYGAQHTLTFYLINAVPQWERFNRRNWNYLEQDVRNFASRRSLDLIIYTGTYGVTTLPHEITGKEVELYLYVDDYDDRRGIPVPRLIWKVLYEPLSKAGVAFIGVNNIYNLNIKEDIICRDICSEYPWLTWEAFDITLGYSYCCSIDDFRKTVSTLPDFKVDKLLK